MNDAVVPSTLLKNKSSPFNKYFDVKGMQQELSYGEEIDQILVQRGVEGAASLLKIEDDGCGHLLASTVVAIYKKLSGLHLPPSIVKGGNSLYIENWAIDFTELSSAFRQNFKPKPNKDKLVPTLE